MASAADRADREKLRRLISSAALAAAHEIAAGRAKMIHPHIDLPRITINDPPKAAGRRPKALNRARKAPTRIRLAHEQLRLL
jgi:hypothetical protein